MYKFFTLKSFFVVIGVFAGLFFVPTVSAHSTTNENTFLDPKNLELGLPTDPPYGGRGY